MHAMRTLSPTRRRSVIPGFGLTMGFTLTYLGLVVLLPVSLLYSEAAELSWGALCTLLTSGRTAAAFRLSFGLSLLAAGINTCCGLVVAWVLVRHRFPGRGVLDALVDLPFALPTAVAGISLATLYSSQGWFGRWLAMAGIQGAYSRFGIVVALTFIGLPFVVRTLEPIIADLDRQYEEAAASLGASRRQTFQRVIFPVLLPACITGFALAFARALGEYGSVVFISGNMPMRTEIVPLLIMTKLEEYDHAAATAIAAAMLTLSFALLFGINLIQWWTRRFQEAAQ